MLDRMVLGIPVTVPPFPTPTAEAGASQENKEQEEEEEETPESTTPANMAKTIYDLAKEQLALQDIMSTMTNVDSVSGIKDPKETELRLPLSLLVNKLMEGDNANNKKKWEAVHEVYPEEVGVPATIQQLTDYMLAWVGATNLTTDRKTSYFDPEENSMKYFEQGDEFGEYF